MTVLQPTEGVATSAPRSRLVAPLAGGWRTTPAQLRIARAVLVLLCLFGGSVAVYGARGAADATTEIEQRSGPLSIAAIDVYRSLAAADAIVAGDFLVPHDPGAIEASKAYEDEINRAATSLARASSLVGVEGLTAARIASVTSQLPVYTELVGRALALGVRDGRESLGQASALMQSTILRRAEALQRGESRRLDARYRQAGTIRSVALVSCLVGMGALAAVQLLLVRRTRRIFNLGLVAASVLVLGASAWMALSLSISHDHLGRARQHSGSVTDALGVARIAAFQARANEVLALVVTGDVTSYDTSFSAKIELLARDDGEGGALGAARQLAPDPSSQANLRSAVDATAAWSRAHVQVEDLRKARRSAEAVDSTVGTGADGAGAAFTRLDGILAGAVDKENAAFADEIRQAGRALDGLVVGTGLLVLAAAAAAVWGIGQRLEEYR